MIFFLFFVIVFDIDFLRYGTAIVIVYLSFHHTPWSIFWNFFTHDVPRKRQDLMLSLTCFLLRISALKKSYHAILFLQSKHNLRSYPEKMHLRTFSSAYLARQNSSLFFEWPPCFRSWQTNKFIRDKNEIGNN